MSSSILISGLAIVRNAVNLNYPFLESIRSALPICDEFVVVVGKSDDETLARINSIDDPRLRIVETEWSHRVKPRHSLLAQQTNIGLHLCRGTWCLYLQSNDVLHEDSLESLRGAMERHAENADVEAMLLERLTFWADYDNVLGCYPDRFKYTIRVVRPYVGTYSIRDAMSMAIFDGFSTRGRAPRAIDTGHYVYRYGFVRSASEFAAKAQTAVHMQGLGEPDDSYLYTRHPLQHVRPFDGTHPQAMAERIANATLTFDRDDPRCRRKLTWKERRRRLETRLYERFGFPRWRDSRYDLIGEHLTKVRHGDL